ncbi:MAG: glucose 1-dehydrogenase [Nanoarchaeota archaeon]
MKLKNKVALVTGSSRGIGKAIALSFAKEGATVIVNYVKSDEKAKETVKEIEKLGSKAIAIKCDVSNEQEVKRMMEKIVENFGKLDILVNNAGIVYDIPFMEKTLEQVKRTFEVNFNGVFLCSKYAAKVMKKIGSGTIINISSTNGTSTLNPESADYDASKAAVISLTKNLAEELAPNIRVNCIAPGWINTDINKDLPKDYIKEEIEKILVKRFGKPEEIARVATFLASDDASFITRSTIIVDGGYI